MNYKTIVVPVVLCGHKTWSVTPKEEHRLRVFEPGAEENIWMGREKVSGCSRELHNKELHNLSFHQMFLRQSSQGGWDGWGM